MAAPVKFPLTGNDSSLFSISSPALVISCLLDNSRSSRYEVMVSYYGFDLHFPN